MNTKVAFALAFALSFTGIAGNHAEAARSRPDLIVSAVSAPSPASPDATIVVSSTVKNQGRAGSKAFDVAYYLSTSPSSTTGAAVLGTENVSSLAAGASVALVTSFTVPGSTASGTYYVVAVVDSTKVIRESNESNNSSASGTVLVTDSLPPTISAVSSSGVTASSATITWTTNEASTSQVEYGLTTAYGSMSPLDTSKVTSHGATLSGLAAGAGYHFRVRSTDAAGNEALSGDYTFTTSNNATAGYTYYVAPTGNDGNPGTEMAPFGTLLRAYDLAVAGDTIVLRGGEYSISARIKLTKSGTSGNPINIVAYPGEVPILDGATMTSTDYSNGRVLLLRNVSWHHLKGIEIKNGPEGGILIDGDSNNNILENLNVHHNGRLSDWDGIGIVLLGTGSNNLLLNNDSHHNRDKQDGNADGFSIGITGSGNVLRGNRAWLNSDDGFDMFNSSYNSNVAGGIYVIENNWAWENGYIESGQPSVGDGNGFKMGGQRSGLNNTSGGHTVRNNVSWKNKAAGFDENDANRRLMLYNNTAYSNETYNYQFWTIPHTLHNNISFSPGGLGFWGDATGSIMNNNSWTLPVTVNSVDFASIEYSGADGPREADGSLPNINFLHLVSGSYLIDTGIDVGLSYTGSAPDLGAYEYIIE